jgi:pyrroline-5-carboxylate reductase
LDRVVVAWTVDGGSKALRAHNPDQHLTVTWSSARSREPRREKAMDAMKVGIVGGGRVARILLGGWTRAGLDLSHVVVSDTDAQVLERLHAEHPAVTVTGKNRQAAAQPSVLFALHPPAFPAALSEIAASLSPPAVLVSLAPKWTMHAIAAALGGFDRLARVIPNAPSIVNKGYNPVAFSSALPPASRTDVRSLIAPLGACPEVAEETLEAYAIVAAMGPTYLWHQFYQLIDLGVSFGLTAQEAERAVLAMVTGAVETMVASGMAPTGVMDLVPVKPLAPLEPTVREAYGTMLTALYAKLKPAAI